MYVDGPQKENERGKGYEEWEMNKSGLHCLVCLAVRLFTFFPKKFPVLIQ